MYTSSRPIRWTDNTILRDRVNNFTVTRQFNELWLVIHSMKTILVSVQGSNPGVEYLQISAPTPYGHDAS